jgi:hypothetical protein
MSGTTVRTYSPDRVIVLVGGVLMSGFAEDTFVEIAPVADLSTSQSGADGEVARAISTDKRCTVTVTLQQTSPANDALSTMIEVDALAGGTLFPLTVQDLRGRSLFVASQAWISKRPTMTFGREINERVWEITTGGPSVWFAGGNL